MDDNKIIPFNLEARVKALEGKLTSTPKLTWERVLKIIWPFALVFVSIVVFLLVNIYNRAPAETVNKHSETIKEHSVKLENYEQRLKWLTETTFDIAKALGINPNPPP